MGGGERLNGPEPGFFNELRGVKVQSRWPSVRDGSQNEKDVVCK